MMSTYYIASCVFTWHYPELSQMIQQYMTDHAIQVVRCCVPKYKLHHFTGLMPDSYKEQWQALPDSGDFQPGDTVYSLCHNCSAILEESKPGVNVTSLWEYIAADGLFPLPDLTGRTMILQDCWRAFDRMGEQDAVRTLLQRMGVSVRELPDNREQTNFCGVSVLRPAPPRNLKLAPQRFSRNANAQDKFRPYTPDEQKQAMSDYCQRFQGNEVVSYCHYCMEGLLLGGARAVHLAELLFQHREAFRM